MPSRTGGDLEDPPRVWPTSSAYRAALTRQGDRRRTPKPPGPGRWCRFPGPLGPSRHSSQGRRVKFRGMIARIFRQGRRWAASPPGSGLALAPRPATPSALVFPRSSDEATARQQSTKAVAKADGSWIAVTGPRRHAARGIPPFHRNVPEDGPLRRATTGERLAPLIVGDRAPTVPVTGEVGRGRENLLHEEYRARPEWNLPLESGGGPAGSRDCPGPGRRSAGLAARRGRSPANQARRIDRGRPAR